MSRERTRRKDDPAAFPGARRRLEAESRRTLDLVTERGGGELATAHDEVLVAVDRVMGVVHERGNGLPDARAVGAVPHAARHARDQRALDLFLQVEHGRVFVAPQCAAGTMRIHATSMRRRDDAASGAARRERCAGCPDGARAAERIRSRRPNRSRARGDVPARRPRWSARGRCHRATTVVRRGSRSMVRFVRSRGSRDVPARERKFRRFPVECAHVRPLPR